MYATHWQRPAAHSTVARIKRGARHCDRAPQNRFGFLSTTPSVPGSLCEPPTVLRRGRRGSCHSRRSPRWSKSASAGRGAGGRARAGRLAPAIVEARCASPDGVRRASAVSVSAAHFSFPHFCGIPPAQRAREGELARCSLVCTALGRSKKARHPGRQAPRLFTLPSPSTLSRLLVSIHAPEWQFTTESQFSLLDLTSQWGRRERTRG